MLWCATFSLQSQSQMVELDVISADVNYNFATFMITVQQQLQICLSVTHWMHLATVAGVVVVHVAQGLVISRVGFSTGLSLSGKNAQQQEVVSSVSCKVSSRSPD